MYEILLILSQGFRSRALDRDYSAPYSLPFRTNSLKQQKQRPVGSVGVEALLDHSNKVVDNYCGVNGMRRCGC